MHEIHETPDQNIFGFTLEGTLTEDDFEAVVPYMRDKMERYTTVRILFDVDTLEGWEPEEDWDAWAFDLRHAHDVDKVAVVGDAPWEPWLEKLTLLFPSAQTVVYEEADDGWDWLRGTMDVPGIGPGSVPDPDAGAQDADEEEPA
jgi:hypothetical protein